MITAFIFLVVLAVLIFVHELGHFLYAKLFKIRVDAFKIGFGPRIFAWTPRKSDGSKGETEYGLNLIPFGGYVKIYGENPDDPDTVAPASAPAFVKAEKARSMAHRPRWQQTIVLFGGVLFNFLFAAVLYVGLFAHGVTATADGFPKYVQYFSNQRIMITEILAESPAEKAGLQTGDVITQVYKPASVIASSSKSITNQGESVSVIDGNLSIPAIQKVINDNNGSEVIMSVIRDGVTQQIHVMPTANLAVATSTLDSSVQKYFIGIAMNDVADMKLPFFLSIYEGGHYAVQTLEDTVTGLYGFIAQAFHGKADINQITGPVGIAGVVGDAARLGLTYLLMITALISINLAVINLIPFPALDGGRILVVLVESAIRRPLPARAVNIVNTVGFAVLMLLMVFVTYRDIIKLVK
jgi:regulator of sigma E protease